MFIQSVAFFRENPVYVDLCTSGHGKVQRFSVLDERVQVDDHMHRCREAFSQPIKTQCLTHTILGSFLCLILGLPSPIF